LALSHQSPLPPDWSREKMQHRETITTQ